MKDVCIVYHKCIEQYFSDIAFAVHNSFIELDYSSEIKCLDTDDLVINGFDIVFVVGMHAFHKKTINNERTKYIGWEFEQIAGNNSWNRHKFYCFNLSVNIFDVIFVDVISKIEFLKNIKKKVVYLPLCYSKDFNYNLNPTVKDIDVLFYGTLNRRRLEILNKIEKKHKVVCIDANNNFVKNEVRANLVSRSKICLNVHFSNELYFEQHRIIKDVICNNGLVLTEQLSSDNYLKTVLQEKYENLNKKINELLEVPEIQRQNLSKITFDELQKKLLTNELKKALEVIE